LSAEELHLVETIVRPLTFDKGDLIIREGDRAKLFFALARGSVSVLIKVPTSAGEKKRRIATLGPGLTFGEMALLDHGDRSADVVADERVVCYGIAIEQLQELSATHPNIMVTILSNLTREFSERLRRANEALRILE
jgi:glutaminase